MAGTVNSAATLSAYVKEQYPNSLGVVVPRKTALLNRVKFDTNLEIGEKAKIALQVSDEHGFSAKEGGGSLQLADTVAHEGVAYEVGPYQMALRTRISYDLAAQASSSKKAFARWNEKGFIPLIESAQKRLENVMKYGRDSIGKVAGVSGNVITLTEGSWASLIWLGAKNMTLDVFSDKAGTVQRNSTALSVASVSSKDFKVTVTGTHTGIVAGDFIFYRGFRGQEPWGVMGLAKTSVLSSNANIYGVNHANYEVLQANEYDITNRELSLGICMEMAAMSMDKGCDEKLVQHIPNKAFARLATNESALRQHGVEMRVKNGVKSLDFSLGDIDLEIVPDLGLKRGETFMYPERYSSRIGSTDWTHNLPGKNSEELFLHVADSTDYEMRLYTAQTFVCEKLSWVTFASRADDAAI